MATKEVTDPETGLVTDVEIALDPSWDRARELLAQGRFVASALAEEIERLRAEFSKGQGGDRKSKSQVLILKQGDGFQAQLRAQLGLHPQEAKRLLDRAARIQLLERIRGSEPGEVILLPGDGASLQITEEVQARAAAALSQIELGTVPASRAWTGFRTGQEPGSTRAAVDHAKNIARGLTALQTSLPHWDELDTDTRATLEKGWALIVDLIPSTFARR